MAQKKYTANPDIKFGRVVGDKELKLHVFPNNMKWPPTAKQIADAGLTPSEHALARRF
jgi:hypothetical protein